MKMNTIKYATLTNAQGCVFDSTEGVSFKRIKEWAKDRGYQEYFLKITEDKYSHEFICFSVRNNRFYKHQP